MDSFNLDPIELWLGRIEAPGIGPCVVTLRESTFVRDHQHPRPNCARHCGNGRRGSLRVEGNRQTL